MLLGIGVAGLGLKKSLNVYRADLGEPHPAKVGDDVLVQRALVGPLQGYVPDGALFVGREPVVGPLLKCDGGRRESVGRQRQLVGVGLLQIVNSMKYTGDYGGLFAAVVIVFLPTFLLYIFLSEKIIAGVTGGGIKG